jgi:hypothetical protein
MFLQEGVLTESPEMVKGYMDELDLKTANEEMMKAGERFGFKTMEIFGKVYGLMAEIAGMMGYLDPSPYGKLLKKWQILAPTVGTFGSESRMLMVEKLGIDARDGKSLLIDWTGFLIGGVKGEGANADQVLAYLLQREREARINAATVDQYKAEKIRMEREAHNLRMVERRLAVMEKKIAMLRRHKAPIPEELKDQYQHLLGSAFPEDSQLGMYSDSKD